MNRKQGKWHFAIMNTEKELYQAIYHLERMEFYLLIKLKKPPKELKEHKAKLKNISAYQVNLPKIRAVGEANKLSAMEQNKLIYRTKRWFSTFFKYFT